MEKSLIKQANRRNPDFCCFMGFFIKDLTKIS